MFKIVLLILLSLMWTQPLLGKEEKNVLILNSYHSGMPWSKEQINGAKEVLYENSEFNIRIYIEHMNTKTFSLEQIEKQLENYLLKKYQNISIDAIIAFDNNALDFITKHDNIFKNIPIFFGGINNEVPEYIKYKKNVSGILEKLKWKENIELILSLHPNLKTLIYLTDLTESGQINKKYFNSYASQIQKLNEKNVIIKDSWSLIELESFLNQFKNDRSTVILISDVFRDRLGEKVPHTVGSHFLDKFNLPIYSVTPSMFTKNTIGGVFVDGKQQGIIPAKMAIKYFSGTPIEEMPIILNSPCIINFNENKLLEYKIDYSLIPKNSEIISEYTTLNITLFMVIIIILLIIISFVVKNILNHSKN